MSFARVESVQHEIHAHYPALRAIRTRKALERSALWAEISGQVRRVLEGVERGDCAPVPPPAAVPARGGRVLRAVAWNIQRGARFDDLRRALLAPPLAGADLLLLSEVDVGLGRSGNRNVARELAEALGMITIALSSVPAAGPVIDKGSASAYFLAKKEIEVRQKQIEQSRNFAGNGGFIGGANGGINAANTGRTLQPPTQQTAQPSNSNGDAQQQLMLQTDDFDATLNDVARESQVLDLMITAKVDRAGKQAHESDSEGVSVSYLLNGRTSLPSRSDRQLIQIASIPMKGDFYRVAIPVLTSAVYEQSDLVNSSKMVLLAGPVSTYVDGQFVGHGDLPTVSIGESFTIGLGIDSSLRAHRELAKKNESIQGGNRVVDFTYQLSLENFGTDATPVRLIDRLPTAKESEVKLALIAPGQPLSEDANYVQQDRKKGMLRWDVNVPAQAIGTKAFMLDYQMQMEYDKQLSIAGLPMKK